MDAQRRRIGEERWGQPGGGWDPERDGERRVNRTPLLLSPDQLLGRAPIPTRRRSDRRRIAAHLAVAAVLVGATSWWVLLPHLLAGPVVLTLTATHGVHLGDLPTLGLLAVAARSLLEVRRLVARRPPAPLGPGAGSR